VCAKPNIKNLWMLLHMEYLCRSYVSHSKYQFISLNIANFLVFITGTDCIVCEEEIKIFRLI